MRPITIRSKIRGVTYRGAQLVIPKCTPGEVLKLQREPNNPADANAIQIFRTISQDGYLLPREQLGYLSRTWAEKVAPILDKGGYASAKITEITGGGEGRTFGVNIEIKVIRSVMKTLAMLLLLFFVHPAFGASEDVPAALRAAQLLREQMLDPDSLVIEHVYVKPDHKLFCIPYRSRNGFGGYSHAIAEYKGGNNLNPTADESMGRCLGMEQNLQQRLKKGWIDLTADYFKAAKEH